MEYNVGSNVVPPIFGVKLMDPVDQKSDQTVMESQQKVILKYQ